MEKNSLHRLHVDIDRWNEELTVFTQGDVEKEKQYFDEIIKRET